MNDLLYWMSARCSGSEQSFRSFALQQIPPGRMVNFRRLQWNLAKLGHAEFGEAAEPYGWRVAPPVLAVRDPISSPCIGFLCGARTPKTINRLLAAFGGDRIRFLPQPDGPDTVEAEADSAASFTRSAGCASVGVQWGAPAAVLSTCTAPVSAELEETEVPIGGWEVSRFSKSGLNWVKSSVAEAKSARSGLFRFKSEHGTEYVLVEGGKAWTCDPADAKYRILGRRHCAIGYSGTISVLSVHAVCGLPQLVERAAVLCSGRLPQYSGGFRKYSAVPRSLASALASLLGQRLIEEPSA